MEFPQIFGAAEECHSSESGWTMYIGSPAEGEEDDSDLKDYAADVEFNDVDEETDHNERDENSDDSMASDASSGPTHREQPWEIGNASRGNIGHLKSYEGKVNDNHCSNYKSKREVKKNRYAKGNDEKDDEEVDAKGAKFPAHGGNKVRKNHWMGKRK